MPAGKWRLIFKAAVAIAAIAVAIGWSAIYWANANSRYRSSGVDLSTWRNARDQIENLRQQLSRSGSSASAQDQMTKTIELAADRSSIPRAQIAHVWPESPHAMGESSLQEQPTEVLLRQVTMRQLVTFLHGVLEQDPTFHVRTIRLSKPPHDDAAESWTVEVVIAAIIDQPQSSISPAAH